MFFLLADFAAFIEMYTVEVCGYVEGGGQSIILVFLYYSDSSRDLEGNFGTGKVS